MIAQSSCVLLQLQCSRIASVIPTGLCHHEGNDKKKKAMKAMKPIKVMKEQAMKKRSGTSPKDLIARYKKAIEEKTKMIEELSKDNEEKNKVIEELSYKLKLAEHVLEETLTPGERLLWGL